MDRQYRPLPNNATFQPTAFLGLAGGVTIADISGINPARTTCVRNGGVLQRKIGDFKSLYGTCLSHFEASVQGDSEGFVCFSGGRNYIM